MRGAASLIALALLAGCKTAEPENTVPVEEVIEDMLHTESFLDGTTAYVSGWIGDCGPKVCRVHSSLENAELDIQGGHSDEEWDRLWSQSLAFEAIDGGVSWEGAKVVIMGRIDATARRPGGSRQLQNECWSQCAPIKVDTIEKVLF